MKTKIVSQFRYSYLIFLILLEFYVMNDRSILNERWIRFKWIQAMQYGGKTNLLKALGSCGELLHGIKLNKQPWITESLMSNKTVLSWMKFENIFWPCAKCHLITRSNKITTYFVWEFIFPPPGHEAVFDVNRNSTTKRKTNYSRLTLILACCLPLWKCARAVEHTCYMSDDYDNTDICGALLRIIQKINWKVPNLRHTKRDIFATIAANLAIWLANLPLLIRVHTMCRAMPFQLALSKKHFLWRWYCGKKTNRNVVYRGLYSYRQRVRIIALSPNIFS